MINFGLNKRFESILSGWKNREKVLVALPTPSHKQCGLEDITVAEAEDTDDAVAADDDRGQGTADDESADTVVSRKSLRPS